MVVGWGDRRVIIYWVLRGGCLRYKKKGEKVEMIV